MNGNDIKRELRNSTSNRSINLPGNSKLKVQNTVHRFLTSTNIISDSDGIPVAAVLARNNGAPLVVTLPDTNILSKQPEYKEYWASNCGDRARKLIEALKNETKKDKVIQYAEKAFDKYLNNNENLPSPLKAVHSPTNPNAVTFCVSYENSGIITDVPVGGAKKVGEDWAIVTSEHCKKIMDNITSTKNISDKLPSSIALINEIDGKLNDLIKSERQFISKADESFAKAAFIQDLNNVAEGKHSFFLSDNCFKQKGNDLIYEETTTDGTKMTIGTIDKKGNFELSNECKDYINEYVKNATPQAVNDLKNHDINLIENPIPNKDFGGMEFNTNAINKDISTDDGPNLD